YDGYRKESVFSIGLHGIAQEDGEKVCQIIEDTFDKVIREEFEKERIDAVLHMIELGQKHQTSNFGLNLSIAVTSIWNHDGNPTESLAINKHVERFKQELQNNPRFLQEKIQHYFKDNRHKFTLTMSPEEGFEDKRNKEEAERLKKTVDSLSESDKKLVYERGLQLMEKQMEEESLACLPTLTLNDLDKNIKPEPVNNITIGGVPVMCSLQPTNEVTYLRMICNVDSVPKDLLPYLSLFTGILTQMGAGDYDYKKLSQQIDLYTGGLSTSPHIVSHHTHHHSYEKGIYFTSYCLDRNIEQLLYLWSSVINRPDFSDVNRLTTLIRMSASGMAAGLADSGHSYAMGHAASSISPASYLSETLSGMKQVSFMKKIAEMNDQSETLSKLNQIAQLVLNKQSLRLLINATPQFMPDAVKSVEKFINGIPGSYSTSYIQTN
ncbi:hypothetical protein LOTGIDRAFT_168577, partial [Lottia gigantea]